MSRVGMINSGEPSGNDDMHQAVRTAIIDKRAGGMGGHQWPKIFPKTDERRCRVIECDSGCLSFGSSDRGLSLRARKTGFPT